MGTGLRCAPASCAGQDGAQGRPMFFHFLVVHKEHAKNGHFHVWLLYTGGAQARTCTNIFVHLWLTTNMQIKVHNVVLYLCTL